MLRKWKEEELSCHTEDHLTVHTFIKRFYYVRALYLQFKPHFYCIRHPADKCQKYDTSENYFTVFYFTSISISWGLKALVDYYF